MSDNWTKGDPEVAGEYLAVVVGYAGACPRSLPAFRAIRDYDPARPKGFQWSLGGSCYQVSHYQALPSLPATLSPTS